MLHVVFGFIIYSNSKTVQSLPGCYWHITASLHNVIFSCFGELNDDDDNDDDKKHNICNTYFTNPTLDLGMLSQLY